MQRDVVATLKPIVALNVVTAGLGRRREVGHFPAHNEAEVDLV